MRFILLPFGENGGAKSKEALNEGHEERERVGDVWMPCFALGAKP